MKKIKVNNKCTCGSNLKYKKCCMLKQYIHENSKNNNIDPNSNSKSNSKKK